tara:strand:- start:280 stop:615 length:336 start_codon:yes stop_codon:yes gene_type:complete
MIDTDKYEGHTPGPWKTGGYTAQAIQIWTVDGFDEEAGVWRHAPRADSLLAIDAPLLLTEVKQLREDINQIPIDLHESLDMILEAHHPEVRESVMAMFGDAIGNNVVGYEE